MKRALTGLAALVLGAASIGCDEKREQPLPWYDDKSVIVVSEDQPLWDAQPILSSYDLSNGLSAAIAFENGFSPVFVSQLVRFGPFPKNNDQNSGRVVHEENEYGVEGDYLFFNDGDVMLENRVEFHNGFTSDIDGTNRLVDLIGNIVPICGKIYVVADATTFNRDLELILVSGATNSQSVFDIKNYTVKNREYEVSVVFFDQMTKSAVYSVNGEITSQLSPGGYEQLADGTFFAHITYDGATNQSQFALDADVERLYDVDTTDGVHTMAGSTRNGEVVEDVDVLFNGQVLLSGQYDLQSIARKVRADAQLGDVYVPVGQRLSSQLDEPQGLPGKLDMQYVGKTPNGKHMVIVGTRR